jgi:hypothetical protein
MASPLPLPLQGTAGTLASPKGWIASPGFDLAFFVLSPLVGLAVIFGQLHTPLGTAAAIGAAYLIGLPHYLSSFSFFLGDENLAYYKTRFLLFFIGPLLIFSSVVLLRAMDGAYLVLAVIFVWNIYHVAAQSSGILSLYRTLNGGDPAERTWARFTILLVNAAMAFWFLDRFPPLHELVVALHPSAPAFLRYACAGGAVFFGLGYAVRVMRRPHPLSFPETSFLATSLLLFCPYLWLKDSNLATLAMLMGHFIQYLAIVWLLNRRKYVAAGGSARQQWLGRVSKSLPLLLVWMIFTGLLFYSLDKGSRLLNIGTAYFILFNSLALIHFYVDGLVWAFKDPFVRRTVGPFVTLDSHRVRP